MSERSHFESLLMQAVLATKIREDIRDSLRLAGYSREIWWLMISDDPDREQFLQGRNRFSDFFEPTMVAHYVNFVITLASLYDTSEDAFSLDRLFKLLAPNQSKKGRPFQEIAAALEAASVVGKRLYLIRSKLIAHRLDKMLTRDYYAEAALSPDELRDLLQASQAIFTDLSYHLDHTREDFTDSAEPDCRALLELISSSIDRVESFKSI
jgi:hypothetical protein